MLYKELVILYDKLDSTSKRLEKIDNLADFLKKTDDDVEEIMLLLQGKVFPNWDDRKIGVASKLVVKAISKSTGISAKEVEEYWKKLGDLGTVAELLIGKKKQASLFPKELTVKNVFENLRSLAEMQGKGSVDQKLSIISEMLINSSPKEAKFISRTVVDNLRIGTGSGSLRDAIVWAFFGNELEIKYISEKNSIELSDENRKKYNELNEKVQHAFDLTNDWGKVILNLRKSGLKGLEDLSLEVLKPINPMLYQKAKDVEDAFSIVGRPAAFEFKMDGFRMQIHKNKDEVRIYTRRLEDVTKQFPEVIPLIKEIKADSLIIDSEAVGYDPKTKKHLNFQTISQRIKRKYDIEDVAKKFPVEVNIFDIMLYNGKNLLKKPFEERRKILEKIVSQKDKKLVLARQIITSRNDTALKFYNESLKLGEEGAMAKNLKGIYKPGSRAGYGVKIKSILEPLDLVIVGADYGEGKRSGWLTSYYLACNDNGDLKEIGKVSTGLKELEQEGTTFKQLTELLKPTIKSTSGKKAIVTPKIVIEVGYEEIQKSVNYSSGYALRFPRFIRLRTDEKTIDDINSIEDVELFYKQQRGRGSTV